MVLGLPCGALPPYKWLLMRGVLIASSCMCWFFGHMAAEEREDHELTQDEPLGSL